MKMPTRSVCACRGTDEGHDQETQNALGNNSNNNSSNNDDDDKK